MARAVRLNLVSGARSDVKVGVGWSDSHGMGAKRMLRAGAEGAP